MYRTIPVILTTALAVVPAGSASILVGAAPAQAAAPRTVTYKGPSVDMRWGPVQVTIFVKGKRITDLRASAPTERPRSAFINEQAIPLLRSEVLQAQSAKIDGISGATMTSEAFYQSLLGALKKAHL